MSHKHLKKPLLERLSKRRTPHVLGTKRTNWTISCAMKQKKKKTFWSQDSADVSQGQIPIIRETGLVCPGHSLAKMFMFIGCFFGPAPLQKCVGDFCCIIFGGFCRGFSWRILLGTFSHKNEEKKSGEKIRGKIRRPKNKNPRKIRSAKSRPLVFLARQRPFRPDFPLPKAFSTASGALKAADFNTFELKTTSEVVLQLLLSLAEHTYLSEHNIFYRLDSVREKRSGGFCKIDSN